MIRPYAIALICWMALFVLGCSAGERPELAAVQGTITLDNKPLYPARVMFKPANGRASSSPTNSAGEFELVYLRNVSGAALGKHEVRITNGSGDPPNNTVPTRYNIQSTLFAQVEAGENTFDFDLKSN